MPLIPSNKLEVKNNSSSILLLRVGEAEQGVVGLQKTGVTGEVEPGLSVRYMGTNENSIASHLVTRYFSAAVLTTDSIARLDNVCLLYTSVRKGNPKGIKDWDDVVKKDVSVVVANPKTSGGARWAYLAAYAYALETYGHDDAKARAFIAKLYKNVPVLDSGARGSTVTFAQRGIGDVLLAWENEAHLALKEFGSDNFEIVTPPLSILAEPPVAVVDKNAKRHGTTEVATAYLNYLYSDAGQEIAAKNFYRPRNETIAAKYAANFTQLKLVTIDQEFGGWAKAQQTHFADGGVFDQIFQPQN